jgi:hypothetical protein
VLLSILNTYRYSAEACGDNTAPRDWHRDSQAASQPSSLRAMHLPTWDYCELHCSWSLARNVNGPNRREAKFAYNDAVFPAEIRIQLLLQAGFKSVLSVCYKFYAIAKSQCIFRTKY